MALLTESDNPLRLVYSALWTMLEASPAFTSYVKEGNRIKFTGTSRVYAKDSVGGADLPEVCIGLIGQEVHLQNTSGSSKIVQIWEIRVSTGDFRTAALLDLNWIILCAMLDWNTRLRDALTWQSEKFVIVCRPLKIEETADEEQLNRGNRGWAAVWRGEVELNFSTTDMRTAAT